MRVVREENTWLDVLLCIGNVEGNDVYARKEDEGKGKREEKREKGRLSQGNYATESGSLLQRGRRYLYVLCTDMMTGFMPVGLRAGYGIGQLCRPRRCNKCDTASMPGKASCSRQIDAWTQNHCYCVPNETRPSFLTFTPLHHLCHRYKGYGGICAWKESSYACSDVRDTAMSPYTTHTLMDHHSCVPPEKETLSTSLCRF